MAVPAMRPTEINGVNLDVYDSGSGEPVVFVHGAMSDECFAVLTEPALADHYRLIHYHRRGWGKSAHTGLPIDMPQEALDCRAVMQHLGVERAHVVGQSAGGRVVLQLVLDFPDTVHTLALLEPALPAALSNSPELRAVLQKAQFLHNSGDVAGATEAFSKEAAGEDYRAVFDRTLPAGWFERLVADMDTFFRHRPPKGLSWTFTPEDAERITRPVLNMTGISTRSYYREAHEALAAWLPQAENVVLPNATHAILQTNPRGAAQSLAGFFSRHPMEG